MRGPRPGCTYWGMGTTLAEETDGAGASPARSVVDGSDTVVQETYGSGSDGHRDPNDTAGTWTWLLDDPSGNVATHL